MKLHAIQPDSSAPGIRRLGYGLFCWTNRHPMFWRGLSALFRRWTFLSRAIPFVASRAAVIRVLRRPESFSNGSHGPNLLAGPFLIGMERGAEYDRDKAVFSAVVPPPEDVRRHADAEARRLVDAIVASPERSFDIVEDYLMWIVLRATEGIFGGAAKQLQVGDTTEANDVELERRYLHELRHVAAQLFAGTMAPVDVVRRAEASSLALNARVAKALDLLRADWAPKCPFHDDATLTRNAVGIAWVSHPVTVQSGALMVQELLGRRAVHDGLRRRAHALGEAAWTDAEFRAHVLGHVRELLRFRPVFPLLARDVPRDTVFYTGARTRPTCPAGSSITVLTIGALFDSKDVSKAASYWPGRPWLDGDDDRLMMFGYGERHCPGRRQALEMLTSALVGLLTLPALAWDGRRLDRFVYDGPMISRMRLRSR